MMNQNDPGDLIAELEKLRELLRLADGNPGLQRSLIETIAKVTREIDRHDVLKSRWLHRDAVTRVAQAIVAIVCEEVADEAAVDRVIARISGIDPANTAYEIKQITQRK